MAEFSTSVEEKNAQTNKVLQIIYQYTTLKVSVVWCDGGVGQPITLSIPTRVEVELGCDKLDISWQIEG